MTRLCQSLEGYAGVTDWPLAIENNAAVSCASGEPDMLISFFLMLELQGQSLTNGHVFHGLYCSSTYPI